MLKASCPSCGKRARYSPEEAGLSAVCAACGSRFKLPLPVGVSEEIPTAEPVEANGGSRVWVWIALIGGVVVGITVGVLLVIALVPSLTAKASADRGDARPSPAMSSTNAAIAPAVKATPEAVVPSPAPRAREESIPLDALASSDPVHVELRDKPKPPAPAATSPSPVSPAPAQPVAVVRPARPPLAPIGDAPQALTDEQIGRAIQRGVDFLIQRLDASKHMVKSVPDEKTGLAGGLDALWVYALLQSGQAISDPRLNIKGPLMKALIERLKQFPNDNGAVTYARALRATALSVYDRPEDRLALRADVQWLLRAVDKGAYTYDKQGSFLGQNLPRRVDNSNSQYGLLGVWSAAEAEPTMEIPAGYWAQVEGHWNQSQLDSGIWPYEEKADIRGRELSMTCAGVASLFVCHDWLVGPRFSSADVGREPFSPSLKKGLDWLEQGDHAVDIENAEWPAYTLYGIERVGLASGFKYLGTHDWFRELAAKVVKSQNADGSWGDTDSMAFPPRPLIDTPYTLLFLARGRHPILMNKLRFDGFWANRPRDLSNLAKYASNQIEHPLNWQVVPLSNGWTDWMDSPILYIASHAAPNLTEADCDNLRQFVQAGGMIYTQADGDSPAFNPFVGQLAQRLFPGRSLEPVPPGHPIFSTVFKLEPKPKLQMVSNGARVLMLHSPLDLAKSWQLREQVTHKMPFQFGVNLFEFATGKREPRNRLDTLLIDPVRGSPSFTIHVARVRYKGEWDPEPYAWVRFSRWFQRQTGYGLDVQTVGAPNLNPRTADIAVLTGSDRWIPTAEDAKGIRNFVEQGGVLLVDRAGGVGEFEENVRTHLFANAFPNSFPRLIPKLHPILNAGPPGMEDVTQPRLRTFAIATVGESPGNLPNLFSAGHGHVIVTPLDLTCGLLGADAWGIIGYTPQYAQSLVKNIVLWTEDGQKEN